MSDEQEGLGTDADGKKREGEREVADFHDTGALRRMQLEIDNTDSFKGRPTFFPRLRRPPLFKLLNKLHTLQFDCVCSVHSWLGNEC